MEQITSVLCPACKCAASWSVWNCAEEVDDVFAAEVVDASDDKFGFEDLVPDSTGGFETVDVKPCTVLDFDIFVGGDIVGFVGEAIDGFVDEAIVDFVGEAIDDFVDEAIVDFVGEATDDFVDEAIVDFVGEATDDFVDEATDDFVDEATDDFVGEATDDFVDEATKDFLGEGALSGSALSGLSFCLLSDLTRVNRLPSVSLFLAASAWTALAFVNEKDLASTVGDFCIGCGTFSFCPALLMWSPLNILLSFTPLTVTADVGRPGWNSLKGCPKASFWFPLHFWVL